MATDVSISQAELTREILESSRRHQQDFETWLAASNGKADPDSVFPERMDTERAVALIAGFLAEHPDVSVAEAAADTEDVSRDLAFRIGRNRVFHLRDALRIVVIDGLGLFFAFATTSGFAAIFYSWFFISGADMIRRFMRCFEKIDDPQEALVFRALYELQNRRVAQVALDDADAAVDEKKDRLSVTADNVHQRLAGQMSVEEVRSVLRGMARRDIVVERQDRWSISFW